MLETDDISVAHRLAAAQQITLAMGPSDDPVIVIITAGKARNLLLSRRAWMTVIEQV